MRNLNFLIKPVSSVCNMRCRYCFYADEVATRANRHAEIMTLETAERLIQQSFGEKNISQVSFSFQGGEPTLAGLDFFRAFVTLAKKYNKNHIPTNYTIQTNGLCITNEWATFFSKNHFLVGISLDGSKDIHDQLRRDSKERGTWNRVLQSVSVLKRYKVDINLLCVVSRSCAMAPQKIYHVLKQLGAYLQFIPCLDPLEQERGQMPYSLTPELYGDFLCKLFDEWYADWKNGNYTSIRLFDDYVHLVAGAGGSTCATSGHCGAYTVVESNGDLYPCDFFCLDEWRLGNLNDQNLIQLIYGSKERKFLQVSLGRPEECMECSWRYLCRGGCKRDWTTDVEGKYHNYYCSAFRRFFAHAEAKLREIAEFEFGYYLCHRNCTSQLLKSEHCR